MEVKMGIMLVIGIFGVLVMLLALEGLMAGEWGEIAEAVAPCIVLIAFLGFVAIAILKR